MMQSFGNAYRDKTVFVTGHTGFKGAWLSEWLLAIGARVVGYALPPSTEPALFGQLGLEQRIHRHILADVNDRGALNTAIIDAQPDFVFHLAAQPLVRVSYRQPVDSFATNVLGTVHVLDALRGIDKPCAAVMVTTDKCYENREWIHGYRENDPLGGRDPYSASKAAAEIAIASFRSSVFGDHAVRIASARAGNVIGGGDWAADRIVPDCVRALSAQQPISVRNPKAVRPWQHVLEPLSGYLWLAALLLHNPSLASAFNFGPTHDANRTVAQLTAEILQHWPGEWCDRSDPTAPHEANLLQLSIDKAHAQLGWVPVWSFSETVAETIRWYRESTKCGFDSRSLTEQQIHAYTLAATKRGLPWAQ
jgi:CDP-glucose 4,6-dehydratase